MIYASLHVLHTQHTELQVISDDFLTDAQEAHK